MTRLVWVEQSGGRLRASAAHAIAGAAALGPVSVLVAGPGAAAAAPQAARLQGVERVLVTADTAGADEPTGEQWAPLLREVVRGVGAGHVFAAATPLARATLPRLCALLDVMQLSEVVRIDSDDTFARPLYAGSALATVQSSDPVKVATLRVTAFPAAGEAAGPPAPIERIGTALAPTSTARLACRQRETSEADLGDARVVVSGGRGMGSAAQYELLRPLAARLGAALGASRAAVDAGYAPPERQVGQTGRIVSPEVYLAFGISGAVQHLAGMKDSGTIVAVNRDPEAPIFQVADLGLVADLFEVLPVLERSL